MNGDERQGDANPISDWEKENSSSNGTNLRVQSRVHLAGYSHPTFILISPHRERTEEHSRGGRAGEVHPKRPLLQLRDGLATSEPSL